MYIYIEREREIGIKARYLEARAHLFRGRRREEGWSSRRSEADNRRVAGKSSLKGSKLSTLMPSRGPAILHLWRAHMDAKSLPTGRILLWSRREEDWGQVRARAPLADPRYRRTTVREFATEPCRTNTPVLRPAIKANDDDHGHCTLFSFLEAEYYKVDTGRLVSS